MKGRNDLAEYTLEVLWKTQYHTDKMGIWKTVKVRGILTYKIMLFQGISDLQGILENPEGLARLYQRWEA